MIVLISLGSLLAFIILMKTAVRISNTIKNPSEYTMDYKWSQKQREGSSSYIEKLIPNDPQNSEEYSDDDNR